MQGQDEISIGGGFYTLDYIEILLLVFQRRFYAYENHMEYIIRLKIRQNKHPLAAQWNKPAQAGDGFAMKWPVICKLRRSNII
jgi:hypothetical protein